MAACSPAARSPAAGFRAVIAYLLAAACLLSAPMAWAQAAPAATVSPATSGVAAATPASVAQAAQTVTAPAPDYGGSMVQMLLGLAVVLALMVGALWLIKQLTQRRGGPSSLLKVVAGTAVGPRERVVIVEVGTTWLVLGVAPGRVTPLAEVPRQAGNAPTFAEVRRTTSADLAASGRPAAGV